MILLILGVGESLNQMFENEWSQRMLGLCSELKQATARINKQDDLIYFLKVYLVKARN